MILVYFDFVGNLSLLKSKKSMKIKFKKHLLISHFLFYLLNFCTDITLLKMKLLYSNNKFHKFSQDIIFTMKVIRYLIFKLYLSCLINLPFISNNFSYVQ